jgi:HEPN domain-containing protein
MPKPLDSVIQRFVLEWLKKADLDLQLAEYLQVEDAPFYEAIAFHSQQATEKYLKAFLVKSQVEFPKIHNIPQLLELVARVDKKLAKALQPTVALNPFGVLIRYPDDAQTVDRKQATMALSVAKKAAEIIRGKLK